MVTDLREASPPAVLARCPAWPACCGRQRAARRPDQPELQGHHAGRHRSWPGARPTTATCSAIDRDHEYHNSVRGRASRCRRAGDRLPARPIGVLVLGFLEGRTLHNDDCAEPAMLHQDRRGVPAAARGPAVHGRLRHVRDPAALPATVTDARIPHPRRLRSTCGHGFAAIPRRWRSATEGTVPCNNDLLAANFIDDGDADLADRLRVLRQQRRRASSSATSGAECQPDRSTQLDELVTATTAGRCGTRSRAPGCRRCVAKYGWTLWGCDPARRERARLRLLGLGDGAVRGRRRRLHQTGLRPPARATCSGRLAGRTRTDGDHACAGTARPRPGRGHRRRRDRHQRRLPPDRLGWTDVRAARAGPAVRAARPGTRRAWSASCGRPRAAPGWCSTPPQLYAALEAETGLATGYKRCGA